jgi:hypothetical protein
MIKLVVTTSALALVSVSAPSLAQTTYTNRASFNAAAGSIAAADFNGYAIDTEFRTSAVDVGPFSLIGSGNRQDDRNIIDAAAGIFGDYFSLNGTSYVLGQVGGFANGTSSFELLFDTPTFAFGADFKDLNDLPGITQITINAVSYVPGVNADFFGYVSTTAFSSVSFSSTNPNGPHSIDNFGFDNVAFSNAAVPEPASWMMMIGGFCLIGAATRRHHTANATHAYVWATSQRASP